MAPTSPTRRDRASRARALARGSATTLLLATATAACSSIPEGRSAVDAIDFEGVHSVGESDLKDKIATVPSAKFLDVAEGFIYDYSLFDPFVLQRDLQRIQRYYQAHGYYEARVSAGRVLQVSPNHVRVEISVVEGQPVLVGEVQVNGIEGLPERARRSVQRALRASNMRTGARFEEDDFSAAEWRVRRSLEDHAYAFENVERHADVDLPHHRVAIRFDVDPGKPATFGEITIRGLQSLPEAPVRRALDIEPGQPYSAEELDSAQQALLDLGVFSSVAVRAERGDTPPPDGRVPITVEVSPTKLRSVELGGGLELDVIKTDVHATIGWNDQNFLGGMRHFSVEFRPGGVLYPTRLPDLKAPRDLLPEERTRLTLHQPGFLEARTDGYLRTEFNVYPLLITPVVDPNAPVVGYREARGAIGLDRTLWKLYADLGFNVQLNSPFAYLNDTPTVDQLPSAFISYLDLLTTLDLRNDKIRPHTGFYLSNEVQLAGGFLPGDATDVREQPQARAYVPIGHATLALRATTGLLFPANYTSTAPDGMAVSARDQQLVYFRGFFSGGSSSNRGYPVYGVGPHGFVPFLTPAIATQQVQTECVPPLTTDEQRERCALPLGGLTLWETSVELRYPLTPEFEEVTFCDASDVQSGEATYSFKVPHLSCGLGLRYQTPVGPIRLDVAYRIPGLNPAPGDLDYPGDIFGVPIGVAFGIGEAY